MASSYARLIISVLVWDVEASFAYKEVLSLRASKSNGSVAGIVSMPSTHSARRVIPLLSQARIEAYKDFTTAEQFMEKYEVAMSKIYALWLTIHTVPAPVSLVQKRTTKVITKLPVLALWLLIVANLLYALLGIILTILALRASSPEVHQVYTRLTTTGLAAQLFDWKHSRGRAGRDFELFREYADTGAHEGCRKRVGVRCTEIGGAEFVAYDLPNDGGGAQWEMVDLNQGENAWRT
jgi:hypothetical protein